MGPIRKVFASAVIVSMLSGGVALAQDDHHDRDDHHESDHHDHDYDRHDHHYVHHDDWREGGHIRHEDWDRGDRVDYRHYHLRRPPRGYEWREVDGNYVLAAVATGVIASIVVASTVH
ncbi:MAG TPA: RcnB family protein [Terracidiphilus sp.]|nr:RcnB family protein [Terracidiphilus sp.]